MDITILGASGKTGLLLINQALQRGDTVTAIARDIQRIAVPDTKALRKIAGDVEQPESIAAAITPGTTLISALGTERADILARGAAAVVAAAPARVIWLGAYGTGGSADQAGPVADMLAGFFGERMGDKERADEIVLAAGGTVFHAGRLGDDPEISPTRRTVPLSQAPLLDMSVEIGRATVAAAMLDEAHQPRYSGEIVVPLTEGTRR